MNRRDFLGVAASAAGMPSWRLPTRTGERLVERWSWVMGQPVHITLFTADEAQGLAAAATALAELRRVEAVLSLFDPASDLVALNERAGRGPLRVSPDLYALLTQCTTLQRRSAGAFNPAVEPLLRAWGFHGARATAPNQQELCAARDAVTRATISLTNGTAALGHQDTRLDLGGIGVGYGLDRASAVLRGLGIQRALLDISGDLIAIGAPPGKEGWDVAIAAVPGSPPLHTVTLADTAVATSSNRASVVRYGSVVTGHIFDPARGIPARALRQVSVVAATGVEADAFSTAMMVSGRRPPGVAEIVALR